ncbi:MAG: DNA-processing protein DprA, partial [Candidatus Omnitrophica bacterium]|nr:DNA-processing protein DprA [Candidatus Omnitrophota bacterium]
MAKRSSILLNLVKSLSPKKINELSSLFPDLDEILRLKKGSLSKIGNLTSKDVDSIIAVRENDLEKELALAESRQISIVDKFDDCYPKLLKEIDNSPLVLYIKGDLSVLEDMFFAIVGSRIPT